VREREASFAAVDPPLQSMRRSNSYAASLALGLAASTVSTSAAAQEPAPAPVAPSASAPPSGLEGKAPATATAEEVLPPRDPERRGSLEPKAAEPRAPGRVTFDVDPLADGAVIAVSLGFAGVLDLINSTGEIRPQQIAANFDRSKFILIDRGAISQTTDPNAGTYSNVGMIAAVSFAFVDPVLSGFRESNVQTGLVDGVIYAESMSLTFAITNVAKMAVRRPRPQAYIDAEAHKADPNYANTTTDSSLSFFSGHAAEVAAVGATATYLAFTRSPQSPRPWITLVLAAGLSTFVSIERVRSGAHFPTDVIAGSIAGAGIGVIVPHLHRTSEIKQRRVWVGYAPVDRSEGAQGGTLQISGFL
jgi:undecaprenyl-diphosphatase